MTGIELPPAEVFAKRLHAIAFEYALANQDAAGGIRVVFDSNNGTVERHYDLTTDGVAETAIVAGGPWRETFWSAAR